MNEAKKSIQRVIKFGLVLTHFTQWERYADDSLQISVQDTGQKRGKSNLIG